MIAIGETLRRERLRRNLDLQQISNELKLSTRFLEAIESEQFDRLPGGVFTRSFVRQYARLLGLDEDEMAAEVARLVEPPADAFPIETKTRPSVSGFPLPPAVSWDKISDRVRIRWPDWLPGLALAVVVTLACSGAYVWWERAQHPAAHAVKRPAPAPQLVLAAPRRRPSRRPQQLRPPMRRQARFPLLSNLGRPPRVRPAPPRRRPRPPRLRQGLPPPSKPPPPLPWTFSASILQRATLPRQIPKRVFAWS